MENQIFTFAQIYLTTILNLNVFLITANGILLVQRNRSYCYRFFTLISILCCTVAIIFIVYSYKEFFVFLIKYDANSNQNIFDPFKPLGLVFYIDLLSLIITGLVQLCWVFDRKERM